MILHTVNILITGGASGLGRTMASHLAGKAANVIVVDRNEEALKELSEEFPSIKCYTADLTDQVAVDALVTDIFNTYGKLHVLVNNAGIIHSEPLVNLLSKEQPKHSI